MEEPTVESFATHCFIEFAADRKLRSDSSSLPLVPPTSATLARAGNVAVTPPGHSSVFVGQEDLIGNVCELIGISERELLVPVEEFSSGLVVLDIVIGVETHHELPNDVLPIMGELALPMWVCP